MPYRILTLLDATHARPLPVLPGVQSTARWVASHRLHAAGYLTRHDLPGAAILRWTLTAAGLRARQRAETGFTLRQARVLLLIPPSGGKALNVTRAYAFTYGDDARVLTYQTLTVLEGQGLLMRSEAPAVWTLTALGLARRGDAGQRLALASCLPDLS